MLIGMKKRKINRKEKLITARKQNNGSPALTFLVTFALVLGVGLLGILVYALLLKPEHEQADGVLNFFWEAIPQKEKEVLAESEVGELYASILADPAYMEQNNIYAKQNQKEGIVTLGFAGDILLDDEYAIMANLQRRGAAIENGLSEALLAQMRDVDIMMVNNEFAFTNRGVPTEGKAYTFRADVETVSYLDDMGVDLVSLANNHSYDFGETGLMDTLDTLEGAGIPYVGAGRNLEEASRPIYFISGDIKIAIISATQIERLDNPDTKGATDQSAGVFRCWNPEKLYEAVAKAKKTSDFVIVYIHWGTENVTEPDWAQLEQAPKLAEAGADLIIGDHPHCLQGFQYFGDTPVIYSLGNFWFNSKTVDTCMVQVDVSKDGLEGLRFIPAIQSDCRTDLAYGTEKDRIISYMQNISYGVSIDSDGNVTKQ